MAPPVRAGFNNRHVVPTAASHRRGRIERAIWGCRGGRATALRRVGRGVRFRAHVSPPGAHRGGPRHDVRRPDRAFRRGARVGDRVRAVGAGAAGGRRLGGRGEGVGAGYYVIGRRVRRTVGIWRYATGVYAVAAAALALLALAAAVPLVGFTRRDWAVFGAMAAGPMLIGHTGMNYALRHFRATTVNVAALGEPVGATLLAWLIPAIHETPTWMALVGATLVLAGIAFSLTASGRRPGPAARGTREGGSR